MSVLHTDDSSLSGASTAALCILSSTVSIAMTLSNVKRGTLRFHALISVICALSNEIRGSKCNRFIVLDSLHDTLTPIGNIAVLLDGKMDAEFRYQAFKDVLLMIAVISKPLPS